MMYSHTTLQRKSSKNGDKFLQAARQESSKLGEDSQQFLNLVEQNQCTCTFNVLKSNLNCNVSMHSHYHTLCVLTILTSGVCTKEVIVKLLYHVILLSDRLIKVVPKCIIRDMKVLPLFAEIEWLSHVSFLALLVLFLLLVRIL